MEFKNSNLTLSIPPLLSRRITVPLRADMHWLQVLQESALTVIKFAQKDDIVIFMWSYISFTREPIIHLFRGSVKHSDISFEPYYVEHPKSKNAIMLVSAPIVGESVTDIKYLIKVIKSRLDSKGVKLISHIYIHDISQSNRLYNDGTPIDWRKLKKIFEDTVKMDQVSLLLTGWEKVSSKKGVEWELKIRRALTEDVESGLLFKRLRSRNQVLAWSVLDEVIDLSFIGLDDKRIIEVIAKRSGAEVLPALLQKEIDELCVELNKSVKGRKLRKEISKYFADRQARIESLLAQMDDNHEIPRKKKEAEATLQDEYLIFRKTMWAFFEEIEKLRIGIGLKLKALYGFKCGSNEVRELLHGYSTS
ncbi:hypothetical protein AN958_04597 [Leucoagaricus sp. SymC.cos]|nr:hypothetical protein AN958_04597 [Leucoagaricus sp. SymC.cos]